MAEVNPERRNTAIVADPRGGVPLLLSVAESSSPEPATPADTGNQPGDNHKTRKKALADAQRRLRDAKRNLANAKSEVVHGEDKCCVCHDDLGPDIGCMDCACSAVVCRGCYKELTAKNRGSAPECPMCRHPSCQWGPIHTEELDSSDETASAWTIIDSLETQFHEFVKDSAGTNQKAIVAGHVNPHLERLIWQPPKVASQRKLNGENPVVEDTNDLFSPELTKQVESMGERIRLGPATCRSRLCRAAQKVACTQYAAKRDSHRRLRALTQQMVGIIAEFPQVEDRTFARACIRRKLIS